MRVLVTRPQPQATQWAERLRSHGVDAHALPLLGITAVEPQAMQRVWPELPPWVVFVSPNAVTHFFEARPAAMRWPLGVHAAAPGPGTADALRSAGVPAQCVVEPAAASARFDSEALWERLRTETWPQRRVLVVRGDGGRDWLADTLRAAGAEVSFVQAYRRGAPELDDRQRQALAQAVAAPQSQLWLFSSSEALGHLQRLAPGADWSLAHALCSHPRIAETARALGFRHVRSVSPAFDAVLAALHEDGADRVNTIPAP